MNLSSIKSKQWFLVIFLFAMLLLTSQVFAKESTAQAATATIVTGQLNVRSGPGVEYSVVTTVSQGNVVNLLGRNVNGTWAYIQTATAVVGWVNASSEYISPSVPISSLPVVIPTTTTPTATPTGTIPPTQTPTPTATSTPVPISGAHATIATGALNVRSGPGLAYSVVTTVYQGNVVSLIGRNANSTWAKIRLSNGTEGWVNAARSYITPNVAISSLPVVAPADPPASSATAVIATGALNVRSGPGVTYSVVATTYQGHTVQMLGRNANSSWVKIRLSNGTEGWVNAASTYITPSVAVSSLPFADSPAQPQPPVPVAPGAVLNLRSGPGFNYPVSGTVYQGLQVTAIGRNTANTWLKVRLSDGQEGWIGAQYVQLSIPIGNLPVVDGTTTPPTTGTPTPPATAYWATVNTGAANIRSGPGIGYSIVTVATQGQYVSLLARNNVSSWAKVQLTNGLVGWINASLLDANVAINTLPIENVQTISSSGVVNTAALNVRTGPGVNYGVTAVLYQGQSVALIGRNADSSWVKIRLMNGSVGWINSAYVQTTTPLNSLPITN